MKKILSEYLFFLLVGVSGFLFIVLSCCAFLFLSLSTTRSKNHLIHEHQYKFMELFFMGEESKITKGGRSGFVSLPYAFLSREDFISYINEDTGSTILITNFGGTTYSCSGSCFCESNEDEVSRRSSLPHTNILSRSLVVLFSAFSTTMAYKIAQETFFEQCQHKYLGICKSENIESEVHECSEQNESPDDGMDTLASTSKHFMCKGHCVGPNEPTNRAIHEIAYEVFGSCEDFNMEKEIWIEKEDKDVFSYPGNQDHEYIASWKFASGSLQYFCEESSRIPQDKLPKEDQIIAEGAVRLLSGMSDKSGSESMAEMVGLARKNMEKGKPFCNGYLIDFTKQQEMRGSEHEVGIKIVPKEDLLKNVNCVPLIDVF